jgi:putative membrane protein
VDESPPRVDPRFLLANERTLLAWIRTALALLAAGGGVYEFTDVSGRKVLAISLAVVGLAATAAGGLRYLATARAIRLGEQLADDRSPVALAVAVSALGIGLIIALAAS